MFEKNKDNAPVKRGDQQCVLFEKSACHPISNTTVAHNIYRDLSLGNSITTDKFAKRKNKLNGNVKYAVFQQGGARKVEWEGKKEKGYILHSNFEDIAEKWNKPAKKIFLLCLTKLPDLASDGNIIVDRISGRLDDLVENGMYATSDNARRALKGSLPLLTDLTVYYRKSYGKREIMVGEQVPFVGWEIKNGRFYIFLNTNIPDWSFLTQYLTYIPGYWGGLSSNGLDLLVYIVFLARQRRQMGEISSRGFFRISMQQIQVEMNLPDEREAKNQFRDIQAPILQAIDEINAADAMCPNRNLIIKPEYDENGTIYDFLEDGYVDVTLCGSYKDLFLKRKSELDKKIEDELKKEERLQIEARARVLEKEKKERAANGDQESDADEGGEDGDRN